MKTILALLALTFVVFFGTSNFGGRGGGGRQANSVVEVDDVDVSVQQLSRAFNVQLRQMAQATGQQIDLQSPIAAVVLERTIDALVNRTLYDVAARDLGISVSNDAVQDAVRRVPAFRGADGNFDRTVFDSYLRQAGLSEAEFVASAREDLQRNQYLGTLRAGIAVPAAMVDAVYKYRSERRVAELATVSAASAEGLSLPDEAQLAAFYEEHKQFFEAPEYRRATIVSLTVEALATRTEIADERVAEAYAERLNEFQQPERRELVQGLFLDKESAQKAAAMVAEGRPFAEAVEEVSGQPPVDMGAVERSDIPEAALADAAFSAAAGTVAGPLESPLGWHLISVVKVIPEQTQPLGEVADDVRQALAVDEARDDIYNVRDAVEDGLASGATLEEVAKQNGLAVQTLDDVSARGSKRDGEALTMKSQAEILRAVFSTAEGEVSDAVETADGGFFIARVDAVTPSQTEPLDRVRDRVTAAWLDSERSARAAKRATELADRVRGGESLETLAAEYGATFEKSEPFDRTGQGSTVAGSLIAPLFAAKQGDVVQAQTQNGVTVARLVDIRQVSGDGDKDKAARDDLRQQLADGINGDVAQQLTAALRERYSVDIDHDTIEHSLLPR